MQRTLLPIWKEYKENLNLDDKELFETFDWIQDKSMRYDLKTACESLQSNPEGKEWLKTFEDPYNEIGSQVISSFGEHHTKSSSLDLAYSYKYLLNNWDVFVLELKTSEAKKRYDAMQLNYTDLSIYNSAVSLRTHNIYNNQLTVESAINELRSTYNIKYNTEIIHDMIAELKKELDNKYKEKCLEQEKKRLNQ